MNGTIGGRWEKKGDIHFCLVQGNTWKCRECMGITRTHGSTGGCTEEQRVTW